MRLNIVPTATLLLGLAWSSHAAVAVPLNQLRTVALSAAAPLPGLPAGTMIEQFAYPRIDRQGRVAFKAGLLVGTGGVNFNNSEAIWAETEIDDLRFVARSGEDIPGTNFRFHDVEPGENLRMAGNGTVYFISGMSPISSPSTFNSGVFRFSKQDGLELAVSSSPTGIPDVPTTNGESISNFLDFNERGDITVTNSLGPDYLLPLDGSLTALLGSGPMINDEGEIALLTGDFFNRLQVRNASGTLRTLALEGDVAPGAGGATFPPRGLGAYDNVTGATVFAGRMTGSGVTDANNYGLWVERNPGSPVSLLMREGDQSPGLDSGIVWSDFNQFYNPVNFGRSGGIALRLGLSGAGVTDVNNSGVWAGTVESGFHLVARAGDQAPGTEPGILFDFFTQAGVTPDGRGVFFAFLTGAGLDLSRDRGIWAEGTDGLLHLIARRGDTTVLPSGATATLTSVEFNSYFGVSESGAIAFLSGVGSGQGVFVSNSVAVPEPGTAVMLIVAAAVSWFNRRRRAA